MIWLVWRESEGIESARRQTGLDACEAAAEWARELDWRTCDYAIVKGEPARVVVVKAAYPDGSRWVVDVIGEAVPVYRGTLVGGRAAQSEGDPR